MLDIGFQNVSRLLASGKPIRVVVLDTQVYSNTGGQACTSGFTGQVADMTPYTRRNGSVYLAATDTNHHLWIFTGNIDAGKWEAVDKTAEECEKEVSTEGWYNHDPKL